MKLPPVTDERVSRIVENPDNARKLLDIEPLLSSVEKDGILQPLGVVSEGDSLLLLWGHLRFACAKHLGMETVPCRVFRGPLAPGDAERLALIENVARVNLRPSEEARAYQAAMSAGGLSATKLAAMVGKSDPTLSRKLDILRLIPQLVRLIDDGTIPETSAPDLAKLSEVEQTAMAESITGKVTRKDLARALGKRRTGRKAEKVHRLKRGSLSLLYSSDDLDELLTEVEEIRKAIKKAQDQGWDFATLVRVLKNVSVPA